MSLRAGVAANPTDDGVGCSTLHRLHGENTALLWCSLTLKWLTAAAAVTALRVALLYGVEVRVACGLLGAAGEGCACWFLLVSPWVWVELQT
jgi:hypothetical protein